MQRGETVNQLRFDELRGGSVDVDQKTLSEISKQALSPYKAKHINGWIQDPRFQMPNVVVYRRNNEFILAADNNQQGSVDDNISVNMSADDERTPTLALKAAQEQIREKIPNASIMTTGTSVGSNLINAHPQLPDNAVRASAKWANNR